MEKFQRLIQSKNAVFNRLETEMRHAEQTGIFDWRAASNFLSTINFCYSIMERPLCDMDGYFAAIFDLMHLYECKKPEVWNDIIETFCLSRTGHFTDSLMKIDYYDVDNYPNTHPCQKALYYGDVRGLRFLLESGVPFMGLKLEKGPADSLFPTIPYEKITENGIVSLEKRRKVIVIRCFLILLRYLSSPIYDDPFPEELGLNKDPSMTVQMSITGSYFSVLKGNIDDEECRRQVPEKFRRDIGDWKFPFNYIRCYRMIFNTIPEPIVTHDELNPRLRDNMGQSRVLNRMYNLISKEFPKIFPESTGPKSPRSLKHLAKCQLRQNIRMSPYFPNSILFSGAARALPLPKFLQDYVLDIDDSVIHN